MNQTIKSFVRREGQVTRGQRKAIEEHRRFIIPSDKKEMLALSRYFGQKEVIAEIGFGMGKATYQIAQQNPDKGYLGFEVYTAGVGKLLLAIAEHQLENTYIIQDDVAEAIPLMIPDASLAGIHCFYPDPWPKKRHHKRRLLQPAFIHQITQKLQQDGYLYIVTDWEEYAQEIMQALESEPLLSNVYDGYASPQEWRPVTRFHEKANDAGRSSWEMFFRRR
ncbi:tRNA (guanosine(46)-N7)-methyltransferase TrmB [Entomospira entomophila]|uniref:tRNA (guanine-N(7)-)-methyltransferase n=1 Tax=Entomospira entomophila TaxID=2719988 RepID=A0A968G8V3_9SPIO|nr:tRNA (guanosine(46)-N7)-methyltransferase TrmB [Entomospira entomophilus]NIZ40072.1 tRNA (guanosine(46)-N7)-methyltransferase TrmB [Entomospira entomophilus]WDI35633.1 tRNA (guanosine(46)-N7)-methyltransferase TrmB [Entomospira entomophilus]